MEDQIHVFHQLEEWMKVDGCMKLLPTLFMFGDSSKAVMLQAGLKLRHLSIKLLIT